MPAGARQQQVTTAHESWRHNRYERPTRTFFVLDLLLDLVDGGGRLDINTENPVRESPDVQQYRVIYERTDGGPESHQPTNQPTNQPTSEGS